MLTIQIGNAYWQLYENVVDGVTEYPWEIVGVDFDTYLTKGSKFNFAAIIDSCLPFNMAQFLSCH
jgi:hypothetical protein